MTQTKEIQLAQNIENTYKQVFGKLNKRNKKEKARFDFLEQVAHGYIQAPDGRTIALETILERLENDDPNTPEEYENRAYAVKEIEATQAMREWYLESHKTSIQSGKESVVPYILEANLGHIYETLESCMEVLQTHRIESRKVEIQHAKKKFDKYYKERKKHGAALMHEKANHVLKHYEELQDHVIDTMAKYHTELRSTFDNALEKGREQAVYNAADELIASGAQHLTNYAISKMDVYQKEHGKRGDKRNSRGERQAS